MQIDRELKDKLQALERIDQINSADVRLLELKFELLHDISLQLVEEIESLGSVRTVNLSRGISLPDEIRAFETHLIQSALERTGGHQTTRLGIAQHYVVLALMECLGPTSAIVCR